MADKYWVGGTGTWDATDTTHWSTSSGGAGGAGVPSVDDAHFDANSGGGTVTTSVAAGGLVAGSLDCTGWTGTMSGTGTNRIQVNGSLTLGGTWSSYLADSLVLNGQASHTLKTNGITFPTIFQVGGTTVGTYVLQDDFVGSAQFTLVSGTLDLNGKTITTTVFSSTNSNTRNITSRGGSIVLTGNNATIWNTATSTNLTLTGALQVSANYSGAVGTRTFVTASSSETQAPSIAVTAGTDSVNVGSASSYMNVDFTGFTGTLVNANRTIYGNLTLVSGMTCATGETTTSFRATSGTKTITTAGKIMSGVSFNGVGGTWQLQDNLTTAVSGAGVQNVMVLSNGILDLNGKNLTTGIFSTSGATAREIKSSASNGKIIISGTGAGTAFDASTSTNLTVTQNTWTIEVGGNTTNIRTFAGGGKSWPSVTFTNTTANGELDFTGSNSFNSIGVSVPPQTLKFTAGTTTTISNTFPSGTAGNLVTVGSITAASHALAKAGGGTVSSDYLSISRSDASPATTWYAGANSTNGGNNTGWTFTVPPLPANVKLFGAWGKFI